MLRGDLDFATSVLGRLLDVWPSSDFATDVRDDRLDDHRARWNAALVAYARVFNSRIGERLSHAFFDDEAAKSHAYFMRLRNRHVAHSVSDFERVGVLIALTRDEPAAVEGLLDFYTTEQMPSKVLAHQLLAVAMLARAEVEARLAAEHERLLEMARSIARDLAQRRRVTEIPGMTYAGEVRARKTRPRRGR